MSTTPATSDQPQDDATLESACFPLAFHVDFYEFLHARRDEVEVITYADFPWGDDWDYEHNYPEEWRAWKQQLRSGERDPNKIYVVLQHDVDDVPERTLQLLREEERLGVRSTSLIFNFRLNQQVLTKEGRVVPKPYPLDDDYLRALEAKGWVIGYHSNAYDQSIHQADDALRIFERDVAELRERFNVDFFCPHGGTRDAEGRSNAVLEMPESLRTNLRWTLNRHSPRFDGSYSDGAINSWNRDATKRDLRDFVRTWVPGGRYRILTHPQYYDHDFARSRRLTGVPWYEEMVAGYEADEPKNAWDDVLFPHEAAARGITVTEPDGPNLPGCPIFIGGDGRSGTTLLNVVLDSHPDLSVGPELHFAGAANLGSGPLDAIREIRRNDRRLRGRNLTKDPATKPFIQFVRRVERAGFALDDIEAAIRAAMEETGSNLEAFEDRCVLVHRLGEHMRTADRKKRWGFKIMKEIRNPRRYRGCWPYAQFVHIIRDGRDVAASQMNEHGSWGYDDIEKAAEGWITVIESCRQNAVGVPMHEIRYEDLVTDPEPALRRLLQFLNVKWNPAVLRHNEVGHAFFDSTVRHPSRAQTQRPINRTAVSRYLTDLTPKQIEAFEGIAGTMLDALGYRTAATATRTSVPVSGTRDESADEAVPVHPVDFGYKGHGCRGHAACARRVADAAQHFVGRIIADPDDPGRAVSAAHAIDLRGAAAPPEERAGTTVRELDAPPGAVARDVRDAHARATDDDPCAAHDVSWWGIAADDGELLAYAALERCGTAAFYRVFELMPAGNGDADALAALHRGIVRWLIAREDPRTRGVQLLVHGAADAGRDDDRSWRDSIGFTTMRLEVESATRDALNQAKSDRRMSAAGVDQSLPTFTVDLQLGTEPCAKTMPCRRMAERVRERLVGRFIGVGRARDGQEVAGVLDLRDRTFDDYIAGVKKVYKGNVVRDARKSDKKGYVCKPFPRALHIPDIVEINQSKEERSGGKMREAYLKSVEEMGGAPTKPIELAPPPCPHHYDQWWGLFEPIDGYTQGEVVTNERLLAYVDFRRVGNLGIYSLIIGHGAALRDGVMYRLHFAILEWLLARDDAMTRGVDQILYAGFYQGGEGLQLWKKKTTFVPGYLVINPAQLAAIDERPAPPTVKVQKGLRRVLGRLRRAGKRLRDVTLGHR